MILKDIPGQLKNISGHMKDVPEQLKNIPEPLKDIQRQLKSSSSSDLDLCFVKVQNGDLTYVPVARRSGVQRKSKLESAVRALLDGPNSDELASGVGTEIPRGTILLGMDESNGAIELNLSKRFASGAGVDSFETRLEQLSRTCTAIVGNQPVYLNVEGKRLNMTPGDGIEVRQPINNVLTSSTPGSM